MTPFVERFGHVQYLQVKRRPDHWRASVANNSICEFDGCRAGGGYGALIFDHCHRHGIVRGILCNGCNVRIGRIEALLGLAGVAVDLGVTAFARWLANCPECPESRDRIAPKEPFATLPFRATPEPVRVIPGPPVALARARRAHLLSTGKRTLCGLVADAMVSEVGKPLCLGCAHRAARLGISTMQVQ